MIAHIGPLPLEELLLPLAGTSTGLLVARASTLRRVRRRGLGT